MNTKFRYCLPMGTRVSVAVYTVPKFDDYFRETTETDILLEESHVKSFRDSFYCIYNLIKLKYEPIAGSYLRTDKDNLVVIVAKKEDWRY